jgi:hypothetical protein
MRWRIFYTTLTAVLAITSGSFIACTSTQTSTAPTASSSQKCQFQVSTTPTSFTDAGGSGSLSISTTRDCGWSASTNANWVSLASANGQGEATVSYSVSANAVPSTRSAAISVEGQSVQLSQAAAPCRYSLSKTSDAIGYAGGQLAVGVTTLTGCAWSAISDSDWLTIVAGASGNASATVTMNVAPNIGAVRIAHVSIGGQGYGVTQTALPAAPTPTPTPSPSPTPTPTPIPSVVQVSGTVARLSGHCPSLTIVVSGTTVQATSTTSFTGGKCSDLSNGDNVDVSGTKDASGTITADTIVINMNKKS